MFSLFFRYASEVAANALWDALRAPSVGAQLDERCHGRGPIARDTILLHAWHTSKPFDKVVFEGRHVNPRTTQRSPS